MKKQIITLMILSVALLSGTAETVNSTIEDFDNYAENGSIAVVSQNAGHNWWTTWDNQPGSSKDGVVAILQGNKCGHFTNGNDQVFLLDNAQTGIYTLSFDMYIPNGKHAYNNLLHIFNGSGSEWATEVYYKDPSNGTRISAGGSQTNFNCPYDTWFNIKYIINLNNDQASFYVDNVKIVSWQYSLQTDGPPGLRQIAAMNFFASDNTSDCYIDNIHIIKDLNSYAPVFAITPQIVEKDLKPDDITNVEVILENSGNTIGDWSAWIDFGQGGAGSQTAELKYYNGELAHAIGSAEATTREIGIRLPSNAYAGASMGMKIVSMKYYIYDQYASANQQYIFRIYGQGANGQPGEMLAEKAITSTATGIWLTANFDTFIPMTGQTYWATVQIMQAAEEYPLTMDGGEYGEESDGNWISNNGGTFTHCYHAGNFGGAWMISVNCQGELIPGTWASLNKNNGSTPASQSDTIALTLNSFGLADSTYQAKLVINTNDTDHAHVEIPLTLNVENTSILTMQPDTLNLGYRPAGDWMRPYQFTLTNNDTASVSITSMELQGTGSDTISLDLNGYALPLELGVNDNVTLGIAWGDQPASVDGILKVHYSTASGSKFVNFVVKAEVYDPAEGDVWETAKAVDNFPYQETLVATTIPLYNNYFLPKAKLTDGNDVVYKLVLDQDALLSASVTGNNGKAFLYTEDFQDVGGPDVDNNYYIPAICQDTVEIGEGTTSSSFIFPMNTIWGYSFEEEIYLADEISTPAGDITAIRYRLSQKYSTAQTDHIQVFMKNVGRTSFSDGNDFESVTATDMVFEGDWTIPANDTGWIEIKLNTPFAYDGTSNLLIGIHENTPGYQTRTFYTTATKDKNMSIQCYSDSHDMNPLDFSTYPSHSAQQERADLQIAITYLGSTSAGPVIRNLYLSPGTYYLTASSTSDEFTVSIDTEALSCPDTAIMITPANGATEINEVNTELNWELGDYATQYCLLFGTNPNDLDTIVPWTRDLENHHLFSDALNLSTTYFWQVGVRNDNCPNGVFSPIWRFYTTYELTAPKKLVVSDGTVFDDETIVLNWKAVDPDIFKTYYIYRNGALIGNTNDTTYTDGPLAYNMNGYDYYVTAKYEIGESNPSNMVNVRVSGYGDVNGHVYEEDGQTGIANATVTLSGQDEFGSGHTYNFTTNVQGYYSGQIYSGSYNGSANKQNYVTSNEPVQGNPVSIQYNETTSPIDFILELKRFTITYMDGDTVLNVDTFFFQQPITDYTPSREGWNFDGWNPAVPELMPAESLTVYAQWTRICDSVTDVDGNQYPTVGIGNLCWMSANMRATHFSDGRDIANVYEYASTMYPNITENLAIYGRLYDWYDAVDANRPVTRAAVQPTHIQGICPAGWRLPTEEDFAILDSIFLPNLRSTSYWVVNNGLPMQCGTPLGIGGQGVLQYGRNRLR